MTGVSRETFAVFMEPMWMEPMAVPAGVSPAQAQSQSAAANLPPGVPVLSTRWEHRADGTRYLAADYYYQGRWVTGIEQSLVPTGD